MAKFKQGDKVKLKQDYYNHPWFNGKKRQRRVDIAERVGKVARVTVESMAETYSDLHFPKGLVEIRFNDRTYMNVHEDMLELVADISFDANVIMEKHDVTFYSEYINRFSQKLNQMGNELELIARFSAEQANATMIHTPTKRRYTDAQIAEARQITYEELFKIWNPDGNAYSVQIAAFDTNRAGDFQDEKDKQYIGKPRTVCTRRYTFPASIDRRTYAFCSPDDEWTPEIGRMIAICKMTGRKIPNWVYGKE